MEGSDEGLKSQHPSTKVDGVQALGAHEKALYDAGKELLTESIRVGREFCKFMVGVSTSSIPVYLGLLKLLLPEKYRPTGWEAGLALLPAVLFLVSAILFVVGYFPQRGELSLELLDEIERERSAAIGHQRRWAMGGFSVYCIAVVIGILVAALASMV